MDWFAYEGNDNMTMNPWVSPLPGENPRDYKKAKHYWQENIILFF